MADFYVPLAYAALVAIRAYVSLWSTGYVHPDEFFQNQEVVVGWFGLTTVTPWEFSPSSPNRSIIFPALSSGLPLWLVKQFTGSITSEWIFLAPRLFMLVLSLVVDLLVYRICQRLELGKHVLVYLASSWPFLVIFLRPFSNSFEAFLLTLLLWLLLDWRPEPDFILRNVLFGAVCGLGFSTRISFPCFALPLVLALLYDNDFLYWRHFLHAKKERRKMAGQKRLLEESLFKVVPVREYIDAEVPTNYRLLRAFKYCIEIAFGFLLVWLVTILIDSFYYQTTVLLVAGRQIGLANLSELLRLSNWPSLSVQGTFVVPCLNNLMYNTDTDNLSTHGLHPHYLHIVANLPLLFGPLVYHMIRSVLKGSSIVSYISRMAYSHLFYRPLKFVEYLDSDEELDMTPSLSFLVVTLLGVTGCSLTLLSLVPHQEPRFLLPLVVPVMLLFGGFILRGKSRLRFLRMIIWLAFNGVLLYVMGFAHQGGVTKALQAHSELLSTPAPQNEVVDPALKGHPVPDIHLYFFRTYMPPWSLLAAPRTNTRVMLHEVGGTSQNLFRQVLKSQPVFKRSAADPGKYDWVRNKVYVMAPSSMHLAVPRSFPGELQLHQTYFPHLSNENPPRALSFEDLYRQLHLNVYRVTDRQATAFVWDSDAVLGGCDESTGLCANNAF